MTEKTKTEHADRTVGGPGSSHQNADKPETHHHRATIARVSGTSRRAATTPAITRGRPTAAPVPPAAMAPKRRAIPRTRAK